MRTILVTGAAGYVGGTLTRRLLADPETSVVGVDLCEMDHGAEGVREILDHPRFTMVRADVRDTAAIAPLLETSDAVVHLAAVVGDPAGKRDPERTREINVAASERLIAASKKAGVGHFVFVSTCSNYGVSDTDSLVTEDGDLNPVSLYAETKVAVERALLAETELPATVCRFATVYGVAPRMRFDLVVNLITARALREGVVEVHGGEQWRPQVHVDDAARAVVLALDHPAAAGETFNVGSDSLNLRIADLAERIAGRFPGCRLTVQETRDPRSYRVSFARIERELGFQAARTIESGVDEIAAWLTARPGTDFRAARYSNVLTLTEKLRA